MKITFYHSPLCPRCRAARKIVVEIVDGDDNLELEEIDVVRHPLRSWTDGVRLFPALKIGDRLLTGLVLGKEKITSFIREK